MESCCGSSASSPQLCFFLLSLPLHLPLGAMPRRNFMVDDEGVVHWVFESGSEDDDDAEQEEEGEEEEELTVQQHWNTAAVELIRLRGVFFQWAFFVHRFDRRDVSLNLFAAIFHDRLG
jgi:hypothetical protein